MTEQFNRCRGTLLTERTVKERPQNSFLTNLFSGRNESVDRDELFAGSGKGSSQVATHIPGQHSINSTITESSKQNSIVVAMRMRKQSHRRSNLRWSRQ